MLAVLKSIDADHSRQLWYSAHLFDLTAFPMTESRRHLELLAPARNADFGIEAINHGADAVYIGGPAFGARANADNEVADIARLAAHAHKFNARVFVALNTILHDNELEAARRLAWQLYEAGADALIVQDMGLLEMDLPPIQLHASTQTDIRTVEKAAFLDQVGFSQMVLARELDLQAIRAIADATPAPWNSSCMAPSASPSAANASSATPIPGAAPTAASVRKPAACLIRCKMRRAVSWRTTSIYCR